MKLVNESKVFKRDESKMRTASVGFILLSGGMWLVLLLGLIFVCLREYLIGSVVLLLVGVFYIFSETKINYCENVRYEFKGDTVVYSYELNSGIMGSNNKARFTLSDIRSVRPRGRYVIIRGTIDKKLPLRKHKNLKKVKLFADFGDERDNLLEALNKCIKEVGDAC